jgi:predicted cobalt transporter CbtA
VVAAGIRRGLVAGLLAGILAGVFVLVVGHQPMSEAMRVEASLHADHADDPAAQEQDDADASPIDRHGSDDGAQPEHANDDVHDEHAHGSDEPQHGHVHAHEHAGSDTTVQRALLPLATIVVGLGVGGLFGLVFALLRPVRRPRRDWQASLQLGVVGWSVTVLAPTLTSPANPPGVGDAASLDDRTQTYLLTIGSALAAAVALGLLARRLTRTSLSAPARQSLVAAVTAVTAAGLLAVLPAALPGDGFPAELLWRFRLVSVGAQTLLWAGVAVGVGLLWDRAGRDRRPEVEGVA